MNYQKKILENGLRIVSVPLDNLESVTLTVWVRTGSRNENKKISGLSHFLEHMAFKGGKKYTSAKAVSETIDAIGGEFNAGTSKEWTNFYVRTRAKNLKIAFDVLADMLLKPLLKEDDIKREKGVILEEIAMYEDTPMMKIGDVFEQLIFAGHSLAWDISGTKESVKKIKRNDFLRYRKRYFYSENMLITVAGGIKEDEVLALSKKYFNKLKIKNEKLKIKEFRTKQRSSQVRLRYKKNSEQAHLILGFLGSRMGNQDRFAEAVLTTILGRGMSSRMFTEVREKRGLAYAIKTSQGKYTDAGYLATYAGVDLGKIEEAIKVILDQHYGLASEEYKISKKELNKAKEYLKGHLALSLEDTREINNFIGIKELLLGKIETQKQIFEGIDKVTVDDLLKVAKKYFVPERLNLAIIGPYKNQEKFEKLLH
jgi:predicted Zn-dependent peptidase